jgi:hypothetical protein
MGDGYKAAGIVGMACLGAYLYGAEQDKLCAGLLSWDMPHDPHDHPRPGQPLQQIQIFATSTAT